MSMNLSKVNRSLFKTTSYTTAPGIYEKQFAQECMAFLSKLLFRRVYRQLGQLANGITVALSVAHLQPHSAACGQADTGLKWSCTEPSIPEAECGFAYDARVGDARLLEGDSGARARG